MLAEGALAGSSEHAEMLAQSAALTRRCNSSSSPNVSFRGLIAVRVSFRGGGSNSLLLTESRLSRHCCAMPDCALEYSSSLCTRARDRPRQASRGLSATSSTTPSVHTRKRTDFGVCPARRAGMGHHRGGRPRPGHPARGHLSVSSTHSTKPARVAPALQAELLRLDIVQQLAEGGTRRHHIRSRAAS